MSWKLKETDSGNFLKKELMFTKLTINSEPSLRLFCFEEVLPKCRLDQS